MDSVLFFFKYTVNAVQYTRSNCNTAIYIIKQSAVLTLFVTCVFRFDEMRFNYLAVN